MPASFLNTLYENQLIPAKAEITRAKTKVALKTHVPEDFQPSTVAETVQTESAPFMAAIKQD